MIYLLYSIILILFTAIIIIDVILYDYDIDYRVHKVLQHIIEVSAIIITIGILIVCVSTSNSSYKSTSTIPIVTPILLPVH